MKYTTMPDAAVILNELHVIEYLHPEGEIKYLDLSKASDGDDLATGKLLELAERVKAKEIALIALDLMHQYAAEMDDEDEGTHA